MQNIFIRYTYKKIYYVSSHLLHIQFFQTTWRKYFLVHLRQDHFLHRSQSTQSVFLHFLGRSSFKQIIHISWQFACFSQLCIYDCSLTFHTLVGQHYCDLLQNLRIMRNFSWTRFCSDADLHLTRGASFKYFSVGDKQFRCSATKKNVMMANSYAKMTSSIWHWHFSVSFPSAIKSCLSFPQLLYSYFVVTCLQLISDSNSDSSPSLTISPVIADNPGQ